MALVKFERKRKEKRKQKEQKISTLPVFLKKPEFLKEGIRDKCQIVHQNHKLSSTFYGLIGRGDIAEFLLFTTLIK